MTRLPSLDLYNEAVQHPQDAFTDATLRAGKVRTNGLGLPLALGGGFAITYSVTAAGLTYAVRMFHKQAGGLEDRYRLIATELLRLSSPYFVQFEYQARGVRVDGQQYPLVKMEWASGETLGSFLDARYGDRNVVEALRRSFRDLAKHLRDRGIAHGDLQNGNVMVDGARLRLVDYDGMFVPGMAAANGSEIGHRHFQHPARSAKDFGPAMDRFSFIALDLTLAASWSRLLCSSSTPPPARTSCLRAAAQGPRRSRFSRSCVRSSRFESTPRISPPFAEQDRQRSRNRRLRRGAQHPRRHGHNHDAFKHNAACLRRLATCHRRVGLRAGVAAYRGSRRGHWADNRREA